MSREEQVGMTRKKWLQNVRVETGYEYEGETIVGTKTELVDLLIQEGLIKQILPSNSVIRKDAEYYDAKGLLALPGFIEKHSHLDKSRLGTNWQAVTKVPSIIQRFESEMVELEKLPLSVSQRAEVLLNRYLTNGITKIRSHVDVHPTAGLHYFSSVKEVLDNYQEKLSAEIVAFPQHGLLRSNSIELMQEALTKGATIVGGVDPTAVDGDMKKSLEATFSLANQNEAGIDIHLHERGEMGLKTVEYFLSLVENHKLQGKVAISHAFALGDVSGSQKAELFQRLAENQVEIMTSVPITGVIPPVMDLKAAGVKVSVGCDNIFDNWSPYGNGDILERVGRLGEVFGQVTEQELSQTLGFITDGVTPLNPNGKQVWPVVGDKADFVFVEASCSAEAVARNSKKVIVMHQGEPTHGSF